MKEKAMHIISVFGSIVAIASLGIIAKLIVDDIARRRREVSDADRTKNLVATAKRMFPTAPDINALDFLYQRLYQDIVVKKRTRCDVRDLVRDHILVLNERLRLIAEEVENTSQFTKLRAVARV
jgi:hypothetical protein